MRRISAATLALVLSAVVAPAANAQLATFDDLAGCTPSNTGGSLISNGYQGFNWSNFYVADGANTATAVGGPGYGTGTVTQRCIALNGFGASSELSAATAFTFNGGYFTSAFSNTLSVAITGYNGTTSLYSTLLNLDTTGPQLLNVNWTGVDRVTFASGDGRPGSQFVYDNFRFNNTIDPTIPPTTTPEPSTIVLLGGGLSALAGLGAARRRRNG